VIGELWRASRRRPEAPSTGARDDLQRAVIVAAIILAALASWAVAGAHGLLAGASRITIYLLANLILAFDAIDLIVRMWLKRLHGAAPTGPSFGLALPEISNSERAVSLRAYAVVASLYNEADDLDRFVATLEPFKDRAWVIDDASTDTTLLRLHRMGFNGIRGTVNRNKPGALRELLRLLPPEIETVVVLDPDVRWAAPQGSERTVLERVISDLQRSGAAALTPRVQVTGGTWWTDCQALEYELSCGIGRKSLRDLSSNSGVSIYRRSALEEALRRHSLSFYAEDLENSLLLLAAGQQIYYDDRVIVETNAKSTWRALFSQRVGWAFGCIRLFVERWPALLAVARRSPLGAYQYLFYLGFNGIALSPLKLVSIAILTTSMLRAVDDLLMLNLVPAYAWNEPLLFVLWYCKSVLILLCACFVALPRGERARHLGTLPFYCVYAVLQYAPVTVGYLNFIALKTIGRRLYADHYRDRSALHEPAARALTPQKS
jgi:cellulose synthase/poly-beta-1,6-N-acetylglucosamine synthase-like glycosyltransferase